jgi:hypothetical protein
MTPTRVPQQPKMIPQTSPQVTPKQSIPMTSEAPPVSPMIQGAQDLGQKVAQVSELMSQNPQKLPSATPTKEGILNNPHDTFHQDLNSDDPNNKVKALDTLDKAFNSTKTDKLPAQLQEAKQELDGQYKIGQTKSGDDIYECPLSQKPCGKKTFFRRVKELFLHMVGMKSQEEKDAELLKLDKEDPITTQYYKPTTTEPQDYYSTPAPEIHDGFRPSMEGEIV